MSTATDGQTANTAQVAQATQHGCELDLDLTVDLKFTWQNTLTTLLALIEDGDSEGKRFARHELSRMAIAADVGADALLRLSSLLAEGKLVDDQAAQIVERAKLATAADKVVKAAADSEAAAAAKPCGFLAKLCGRDLELTVCYSARGFYIGTRDEDGSPFSRESDEYWNTREGAEAALASGSWSQKPNP